MHAADARLHNISVVIVADTYQPDVIYRDLVNGRVMPDGLEILQSSQVPDRCEVMYRNGIRIDVIPQRVIIGNNYDELFKQCLNEEVHTLAAEFVKTYNDVVCQAIGLNCTISLQHNNPLRWMTRKFLKVKTPPKNVSMIPQFVIKTDDAKLTLAFSSVKATDLGRQKRFIAVDCNHHHGGPFKADGDISRIVMGWRNTQDTILLELGAVLELK